MSGLIGQYVGEYRKRGRKVVGNRVKLKIRGEWEWQCFLCGALRECHHDRLFARKGPECTSF